MRARGHNDAMLRYALPFFALPLLASCVGPATPPPAAAPAPRPAAPMPAPPATVERHQGDWSYAPLTPGDWRHSRDGAASVAHFASGGGAATVMLRCDAGRISLMRAGVVPADMAAAFNIRTSAAERQVPMRHTHPMLTMTLPARDPLWDQIVYSRGRFVIEATRQPALIVPTRPEIARVVEDCRG